MNSRQKAFFKEAEKNLKVAKEELFKPSEDMVSYSVCKNSQFAIENFLKGFLTEKGIVIDSKDTISTLFEKCKSVDSAFKDIDMNAMGCKNHAIDSRYCSEINSVSACFDTADSIDTYFRKKNLL